MSFHFAKLAAILTFALAGCATAPSETTVQLSINGTADMNGGAPAQVKVYYLTSPETFASADFFALFNQPEATLGQDLVAVDEYQLAPGRTVTDVASVPLTATSVGVVAAFRDIDNSTFKAVRPLVPGAVNSLQVTLSGNTVSAQ